MIIDIISPEKTLFTGDVEYVSFPGSEGYFGVLKNHAPIVSTLTKGAIVITPTGTNETQTIEVNGGVVEVGKDKIIVLAE